MTERRIADHHVLDVSDHVHCSIVDAADAARQHREIHAAVVDPVSAALVRNSRAMIDVDYSGSPLVVDYGGGGASAEGPRPGQWYPDWSRFGRSLHQILVFGEVEDAEPVTRLARRWSKLVDTSLNPKVDPKRAGLANGGVVLIRPDGHIGFRFPSTENGAFKALNRHLSSYLISEAGDDG
jgi:hypothetical protein